MRKYFRTCFVLKLQRLLYENVSRVKNPKKNIKKVPIFWFWGSKIVKGPVGVGRVFRETGLRH